MSRQRPLRRYCSPGGFVRAPEREEERVALIIDFLATMVLRRRAKDPPMRGKEIAVPSTQPL
jgi:hypothetical protein